MASVDSISLVPFASRVMMNIMLSGLKLHHLSYSGVSFSQNLAKVPLSTKREFLRQVSEEYGLEVIVKLGRGAALHLDEPIGLALVPRGRVARLFSRWQRLERYVHANHYTDIELHPRYAIVQHLSHTEEEPVLEEDLAVLGLMCALVAHAGASNVELFRGARLNELVYRYSGNQVNVQTLKPSKYWKISWQNSIGESLSFDEASDTNQTWESKVRAIIGTVGLIDCNQEAVAERLYVSARSLQRHLGYEGVKFSHLVQEMRVNQASKLILEEKSCLAEIGFLCGFSDQAHFTRVFNQWNGMSPKAYLSVSQ